MLQTTHNYRHGQTGPTNRPRKSATNVTPAIPLPWHAEQVLKKHPVKTLEHPPTEQHHLAPDEDDTIAFEERNESETFFESTEAPETAEQELQMDENTHVQCPRCNQPLMRGAGISAHTRLTQLVERWPF